MLRRASDILFAIALLVMVRPAMSFQQPTEQAVSFQWLAATGETSGVKFQTHRLQPISLRNESGLPVEMEQESVKVDDQTTRITRRAFTTSVNGERQLTETVVEEIRKLPGDRVQAVRTTSRKDINGRFSPVQQEVQEVTPSGTDVCQIKQTLLLPGANGALVAKEQVQQTERKTGDKAVELDRIRYVTGINGNWKEAERRVSQNTVGEDRTRTNEQVYQYDINNKLSLTRQLQSTEWKDATGRHFTAESFTRGSDGKLQLDSRTTVLQTPQHDGRQATTEILEKPSPTAPGEGLKVVRKIVENVRILNPNETERQMDVLEPDLNGGMRSLYYQQSVEAK